MLRIIEWFQKNSSRIINSIRLSSRTERCKQQQRIYQFDHRLLKWASRQSAPIKLSSLFDKETNLWSFYENPVEDRSFGDNNAIATGKCKFRVAFGDIVDLWWSRKILRRGVMDSRIQFEGVKDRRVPFKMFIIFWWLCCLFRTPTTAHFSFRPVWWRPRWIRQDSWILDVETQQRQVNEAFSSLSISAHLSIAHIPNLCPTTFSF